MVGGPPSATGRTATVGSGGYTAVRAAFGHEVNGVVKTAMAHPVEVFPSLGFVEPVCRACEGGPPVGIRCVDSGGQGEVVCAALYSHSRHALSFESRMHSAQFAGMLGHCFCVIRRVDVKRHGRWS